MTTTTLDTGISITRQGWTKLLPPLAGLGLVAGLIMLMVSPASDDTGESPAEVVAYASSHEGWNIAILLFGLASVALGGMFVAGLLARLRTVATEIESGLVLIGGMAFTLCFAFCWIIWMAPLADMPGDSARALSPGRGLPRLRRRRLVPARRCGRRRGPHDRPRIARCDPRGRSRVARLARRGRRDRISGDRCVPGDVRLVGVDRGRVDRAAGRASRVKAPGEPSPRTKGARRGGSGGGCRRSRRQPPPPSTHARAAPRAAPDTGRSP